ncbi:hypothetical protein ACA910_016823 [Epithemia clementina (nom. ined.)]
MGFLSLGWVACFVVVVLLPNSGGGGISMTVAAQATGRKIQILNESKSRIEVYWIHPHTREASLMSTPDIMQGADFVLDSFVGHEFQVQEKKTCKDGVHKKECRKCNFVVSENDDQNIHVNEGIECVFVDNKVRARQEARNLVSDCHQRALSKALDVDISIAMKDLVACVQGGVASRLEEINEEIAFQSNIRKDIAGQLENYTCLDDSIDSSPSVSEKMWIHDRDPASPRRKVMIKHDRPASKIHVIQNFINPDECRAMEEMAQKSLHRATVADGRGGSRLSESRKAMQAGITVPWHLEANGDPIARLSRRVYDYTNDVLGLNLSEQGQEDLMSIQYFGRGFNDTEPDRYTPHCDGECTGLKHKSGTRMATMVMYCTVADRGGHTNFRNAGVHVKPEVGNAIFFSYIDPVTRLMDTGFTEHSGCPVFEGQKKIVTQWIRLGVDSENPWDSFNTLGVQVTRAEMEDDEDDVPMEEPEQAHNSQGEL